MASPKRPKDTDYLYRQEEAEEEVEEAIRKANAAIERTWSKLDNIQTNEQLLLQYLRNDKRTKEGFGRVARMLHYATVSLSLLGVYDTMQNDNYYSAIIAAVAGGISYALHRGDKGLQRNINRLDARIAKVEAEMTGTDERYQETQKLGNSMNAVSDGVAELANILTNLAPDNNGKPKKLD